MSEDRPALLERPHAAGDASTPDWKHFEKAVAAVQRLFTPVATVSHDEKIVDRLGQARQFDVVIRDQWGASPMLGVIECKNWKERVDVSEIDAFHTKSQNVCANLAVIVSRSGFTENAIAAARHYGIGTMSLLPSTKEDAGFRVGFQSFATIYGWKEIQCTVHFVAKAAGFPAGFALDRLLYKGQPIVKWFFRELSTTHRERCDDGWTSLALAFDKPRLLEYDGKKRLVRGVEFSAHRTIEVKTKFIGMSGPAFWDWQTQKLHIPGQSSIVTDSFDMTFEDWENYSEEIPNAKDGQGLSMNITCFRMLIDGTESVTDLTRL